MAEFETTFADLGLKAPILEALTDLGYEKPSPIQAECIPHLLGGRDVLGMAQTGSGKTAAFSLPLLNNLDPELKAPQILVLAPTRELAVQVAEAMTDFSKHMRGVNVVALLGPSGSGKTTLLRIIAGLEHQSSGHIRFHGTDVSRLHARERKVGFVFQHYALFRHMTVFDNIAFGLTVLPRRDRPTAAAIKTKVTQLLEMVQLAHLADRFPAQLSGGQKQRVALARALAVEPQILLLDEPFGALDAQVRKELRRWLRQLHEELKFTSVFVTHDQEEATEVADRVVVMSQGNIEQADAPDRVWREPATRFVLEFMGEVNRLTGTVRGGQFHVGAHRWPLGYTPAYQGPVDLFLRPWEVDISRRTSLDSPLPVQVIEASPKGHYTQLVVQPLGWYHDPLTVVMAGEDVPVRGERLFVGLQKARLYNGDQRIETREEELALAQSA